MKKSSNQNKIPNTQLMDLESSKENLVQKRRKRAPKVYKNQQDLNLDFLDTSLVNKQLWKENWLDGYQYYMLLKNQHRLDQKQFPLLSSHPTWIYEKPINGHLYFLKEVDLEKDSPFKLGFPRTSSLNKKSWKWKRNNFPTKLPKNDPKIVYICATTEGVEQDENGHLVQKRFRMHIAKKIDLYNKELQNEENSQGLVVCQMLEIEFGKTKEGKKYIPKPISQIRKKENLHSQKKKVDKTEIKIEVDDHYLDINTYKIKNNKQNLKSSNKYDIFDYNRSFECDNIEIESDVSLNNKEIEQEQSQSIKIENQVDHISSTAEQCTAAISIENDKIFEKASQFKDQLYIHSSQLLGSQNQSQDPQIFYQNYFNSHVKEYSNDPLIYLKNSIYSSQKKNQNLMLQSSIQALKNIQQSKIAKKLSGEESSNSNQRSSQQKAKFSKKTSPIRKRLFQNYENNSLFQYQDIFSYSNTQYDNNSPQISEHTQNSFNIFNTQKNSIVQNSLRNSSSNNTYNFYFNYNFNNYNLSFIYDNLQDNQNNPNLEFQDFIESQEFPDTPTSKIKKIDQNQRKNEKKFCIFDQFQDVEEQDCFFNSKNNQQDAQIKKLALENVGKKIQKNTLSKIYQEEKDIECRILVQPVLFKQCKKNKDEYYAILV
ncbi:hypothetical protein ABPG72_002967 [Tetrahymena utriculariae]